MPSRNLRRIEYLNKIIREREEREIKDKLKKILEKDEDKISKKELTEIMLNMLSK